VRRAQDDVVSAEVAADLAAQCAAAGRAHSGNRELVDVLLDVANVVRPQMAGVAR
jgi:hypothetical protein